MPVFQDSIPSHGLDLDLRGLGSNPSYRVWQAILKAKLHELPKPRLAGWRCRGINLHSMFNKKVVSLPQSTKLAKQGQVWFGEV